MLGFIMSLTMVIVG